MKSTIKLSFAVLAASLIAALMTMCGPKNSKVSDLEHTLLQSSREWDSLVDIRCDIAMVYGGYGINGDGTGVTHNPVTDSWRDKGYKIFRTTTDEIALFWHARRLSKIFSKDGALTVSSATSVVLRLPEAQASGTVLLDGKPVLPLHAKRPGRFIPVPGGTHTIELK